MNPVNTKPYNLPNDAVWLSEPTTEVIPSKT